MLIREIGTIKRALRRKYYIWFRPIYIKEQMKKRRGICGKHGCCDFSIFQKLKKCPNLSKEDSTKCLRWDNLPKICQIYPLDEKDKIPETKDYCNFHWED